MASGFVPSQELRRSMSPIPNLWRRGVQFQICGVGAPNSKFVASGVQFQICGGAAKSKFMVSGSPLPNLWRRGGVQSQICGESRVQFTTNLGFAELKTGARENSKFVASGGSNPKFVANRGGQFTTDCGFAKEKTGMNILNLWRRGVQFQICG